MLVHQRVDAGVSGSIPYGFLVQTCIRLRWNHPPCVDDSFQLFICLRPLTTWRYLPSMTQVMSLISTPKPIQTHPNPSKSHGCTTKKPFQHGKGQPHPGHPPILPSKAHPIRIPWLRRWNEDTPEQAVGIHDRIRAVNGASGTPEERQCCGARVVGDDMGFIWVALGWVYPEKMGCNPPKIEEDHPDMMDFLGFLKPDMGRKMWGYHQGNGVKLWCWVMKYEESIIIYWGSCHQTCGDIIWGVLGHES